MPSPAVLRRTPGDQIDPDDAPAKVRAHGEPTKAEVKRFPRGYTPHGKQRVAHYLARLPQMDVTVVNAGRRGGKSEWAAADGTDHMLSDYRDKRQGRGRWEGRPHAAWRGGGKNPDPFLHYIGVAPTYAMLDPFKRKFQRLMGGRVEGGGLIVHQTDQTWWLLGGIRLDWRSGDRPERIVGDAYDGALLDEFARMKPALWDDNLQPALADSGGWCKITSTPLGKSNVHYRVWSLGDPAAAAEIAEANGDDPMLDPHVACVGWHTIDNPSPKIQEYAERMRRRMPLALWKRNFAADFDSFEGQCLDLDRGAHFDRLHPAIITIKTLVAGKDFGDRNPGVIALWGIDGDGVAHGLESRSAKRMNIDGDDAWRRREGGDRSTWTNVAWEMFDRWAKAIGFGVTWQRIPLYLPHDNPEAVRRFRSRGFDVRSAHLDRLDGLQFAQMGLHNREIVLHDEGLYRSWSSLQYPDNAHGRDGELWDKAKSDDHAWDASRYALSEQVQRSGLAGTPQGKRDFMGR